MGKEYYNNLSSFNLKKNVICLYIHTLINTKNYTLGLTLSDDQRIIYIILY